MFRSIFVAVLVFAVTASARSQDWAAKMFETNQHSFDTVARNAKAEFAFKLTNPYVEDVHIAAVRSSCTCTTPSITKEWLKTYEDGAILAHFNTDRFVGQKGATITVLFDKPFVAEVQLQVSGFIRSDVVIEPGSVNLGEVSLGQAATQRVAVNRAGFSGWKILEAKSANAHLSATVVETSRSLGQVGYQVEVHLDAQTPPGYLSERLMLVTNDPSTPQIPLVVEGRIETPVALAPASLFMGVVKPGEKVTRQLIVKGKQPFRILSISCDDERFQFGEVAADEAKPIHIVPVTFEGGAGAGKISKKIRIVTDLGETTVPECPAYAVVAP